MLRVTLSRVQAHAGVSYAIMAHPQLELPHLEAHWIPTVRRFLSRIDGHLHLDGVSVPQPNRGRDVNLMDTATTSHLLPASVRRFNYCRLFLGVTWLLRTLLVCRC